VTVENISSTENYISVKTYEEKELFQ